VSPVLANLFMHDAFDMWPTRTHPRVVFERYADHAVWHCDSEAQAREVLAGSPSECDRWGLRLHPEKTQIMSARTAASSPRSPPGIPHLPALTLGHDRLVSRVIRAR
jgi:hypothetical protein